MLYARHTAFCCNNRRNIAVSCKKGIFQNRELRNPVDYDLYRQVRPGRQEQPVENHCIMPEISPDKPHRLLKCAISICYH